MQPDVRSNISNNSESVSGHLERRLGEIGQSRVGPPVPQEPPQREERFEGPIDSIEAARKKWPMYAEISDSELVNGIRNKYYPELSIDAVAERLKFKMPPGDRAETDPQGFVKDVTDTLKVPFSIEMGWGNRKPQFGGSMTEGLVGESAKFLSGNADYIKKDENISRTDALIRAHEKAGDTESAEYRSLLRHRQMQGNEEIISRGDSNATFSDTVKAVAEVAGEHPGILVGEFLNMMVADPYLMLTPLGWEKAAAMTAIKAAKYGRTAKNVASFTAGATSTAATGAATIAPISIFEQLNENGVVDQARFKNDLIMGAAAPTALVAPFKLARGLGRGARAAVDEGQRLLGSDRAGQKLLSAPEQKLLGYDQKLLPQPEVYGGRPFRIDKNGSARLATADDIAIDMAARRADEFSLYSQQAIGPERQLPAPGQETDAFRARFVSDQKLLPAPEREMVVKGEVGLEAQRMREHLGLTGAREMSAAEKASVAQGRADAITRGREASTLGSDNKLRVKHRETENVRSARAVVKMNEAHQPETIWRKLNPSERKALTREFPAAKTNKERVQMAQKKWGGQSGFVEMDTLAAIAAGGTGAALAFSMSEGDILSTFGGAVAGLGTLAGGRLVGRAGLAAYKAIKNPSNIAGRTKVSVSQYVDDMEGRMAIQMKNSHQYRQAIVDAVPDQARREAITHWLEGDRSVSLSKVELDVAKQIRKQLLNYWAGAKAAGVIDGFLDNYMPHIWRRGAMNKSEIMGFLSEQYRGAGMGTKTMHGEARIIPSYKDGMKAGLEPVTLDAADLIKLYGDNVNRAILNKGLQKQLAKASDDAGNKLIMKVKDNDRLKRIASKIDLETKNGAAAQAAGDAKKAASAAKKVADLEAQRIQILKDTAPPDYVHIDHPQLRGMMVHPEIADSMRFIYDSTDPRMIGRGIQAVNFFLKRSLVSASLFHLNALVESMAFAGRNPVIALQLVAHNKLPAKWQNKMLLALNDGKVHPELQKVIDDALKAGLKIGTIEDLGGDLFYAGLRDLEKFMDSTVFQGAGKIPAGYAKMSKAIDRIMWDQFNTGAKLIVFQKEAQKALETANALQLSNPAKYAKKYGNITNAQLEKEVAEYVNDAFGGLNWRMIAEKTRTRVGRSLKMEALSPRGRKSLQFWMFAPDWTIANFRVLAKAIPGVASSNRIAAMHRAYFMRASLIAATAGNAANYLMSGHFMWDNEDWTMLDMGDGRKMTLFKQYFEPIHWATNPLKTGLNKMGIIPRMGAEILQNQKWVSPRGMAPPIWDDDANAADVAFGIARHVAQKPIPIWSAQVAEQGWDGFWGWVGHPVYGETDDQKAARKAEQKEKRKAKADEKKASEPRLKRSGRSERTERKSR